MLINKLAVICPRIIFSEILKTAWVFPLNNNKIFFQSYEKGNGFTDNPKYLCKYLHEKNPGRYEFVFVVNKNADNSDIEYIKKVRCRSVRWLYELATSKVVVVNVRMPTWLSRRKGQLVINTWHAGGAFKRTGVHENAAVGPWIEKRMRSFINLFISSSEAFTRSNILEGMQYEGEILNCGMPRNDVFFSQESIMRNSAVIRHQYGLGDALCVLFAPTFRGHGDTRISSFPPLTEAAEALRKKTGRDVVILVRKHHRDMNSYDIPGVTVDVSNHPDIQEILCCTDILITDYSSVMWDFSLLGRPCFLFVTDLKEYEKDRGFFTPIEEWPGIICHDDNELLHELSELDPERSRGIAERYLADSVSYENGKAAETIAQYIYEFTTGQKNG